MLPIKKDLKLVKSLHQKKFRKEHGLFLVEGKKPVLEALASSYQIQGLFSTDQLWIAEQGRGVVINAREMEQISTLSTPSEHLAVVKIPEAKDVLWGERLIILDGIADPGNMGTILRTADWFGFNQIICSEDTVEMYNPKVVQSTMGSLFRMQIQYTNLSEIMPALKAQGYRLAGADLSGQAYMQFDYTGKLALVIGSESHGLKKHSRELLTDLIHIPGSGNAESLNAGIATGILLARWFEVI
jgi:RNA methyltransferase, TrmH family